MGPGYAKAISVFAFVNNTLALSWNHASKFIETCFWSFYSSCFLLSLRWSRDNVGNVSLETDYVDGWRGTIRIRRCIAKVKMLFANYGIGRSILEMLLYFSETMAWDWRLLVKSMLWSFKIMAGSCCTMQHNATHPLTLSLYMFFCYVGSGPRVRDLPPLSGTLHCPSAELISDLNNVPNFEEHNGRIYRGLAN